MTAQKSDSAIPPFPSEAVVGSLGELSRELCKGTEVPEELVYATALTCFGSIASGKLKVSVGLRSDTRLYTLLLGGSYAAKKSSAMSRTVAFFENASIDDSWIVIKGIGSAEGLAQVFETHPRVLLSFDEVRSFVEKTKVQSSVLLPLTTSLYEGEDWDNQTKRKSLSIRGARLSLVGCCTTETYEHLWTADAIAIGLPNRLFVVYADAKPKVAWPRTPDQQALERLRQRIRQQLARLPLTFDVTPDAKRLWEDWYVHLPESEHAKRLDTLGFRLMPILALSMDKEAIDIDVMKRVIAILDYELRVRILTDPVDADDRIARLEEKIRRCLKAHDRLKKRDLRRAVHADREGIWAFERALNNLMLVGDVGQDGDAYVWTGDGEAMVPVPAVTRVVATPVFALKSRQTNNLRVA